MIMRIKNGLQNPEFVRMLGLTPNQVDALQKGVQEAQEKYQKANNKILMELQEIARSGNSPNAAESQQRVEQMRDARDQFVDVVQMKMEQVLKPEQLTKVKEMSFQLRGSLEASLADTTGTLRYLEALDITATQKEQVRNIMAERDEAIQKIATEYTAEIEEAVRAVMPGFNIRHATPEERTKYVTIISGEEFRAKREKFQANFSRLTIGFSTMK